MLTGVGLARLWPHDRAHFFFARAAWDPELLGIGLSHVLVRTLIAPDAPLVAAVDDTLFKRSGKEIFGAAWQHDGAAKGPKQLGRGTCFVVLGLIVHLPFLARPVCRPVMCRLWRPDGRKTKVELAAAMIRMLSACHHRRRLIADAAYHGPALRHLPAGVTLTTRLPKTAVLYEPTPAEGRPPGHGDRTRRPPRLPPRDSGSLAAPRERPALRVPLPLVRLAAQPDGPRSDHP
ncbi:transposase [Streptomyces sp. NPDC050844]|uniref:transposase n=1 Tax=Streptomyces sp. NPDC050844 TaxID=3155790 RepID=UPI0033E14DB6